MSFTAPATAESAANVPPGLPIASTRQVRRELVRLVRAEPGRMVRLSLAMALLVTGSALELVVPYGMGRVVDLVGAGTGTGSVWPWAAAMATALAVGTAAVIAGSVLTRHAVEEMLADLRERLVGHALVLPTEVIEQSDSGDVVSRATDDVAEVSEAADLVLPVVAGAGVTVAVTLLGLGALEWRLALPLVLLVPFHVWSVRRFTRAAGPIYAAERAAMAQRAEAVLSTLRGRSTVTAFGLESRRRGLIEHGSWQVVVQALRARVATTRFFARVNLGEFVGMAGLLLVGFVLVGAGEASVGVTITAVLFFHRLFTPIGDLLMLSDVWESASASLRRIIGVLQVPRDPAPAMTEPPRLDGTELVLDDIRFSFGVHEVIRGVSVTVPAGATLALVGPSGAGKSTLAAVISGSRRLQEGAVRLGGVDLSDLEFEHRAGMAPLLTQEGHLFGGTVRDNLTLGREMVDEDLWRALDLVGAADWVASLPDGLATLVGPDAVALPMVGAQQLALARIAALDPPLVLLDEASAESGSAGAAELDRAVDAVVHGRTAVVVAHRLDQAARAELVAFMADGTLAELGDHKTLLARGGRYAEAWKAWCQGR